jgi:protein-tyrosine phosphatase
VTIKRLSHPIRDMNVTTAERYDRIIADIERQLAAGRRVYIHCWGGVGRTGTVVGIWHVHQGHDPVTALELIREARAGTRKGERPSPETERQVAAIREAHARL